MRLHPVVLCGGPGARLWPASTAVTPKPFIDLIGGASLFERTLTRLAGLNDAGPVLVVTGESHADEARRQIDRIGVSATVMIEPEGRDSAPALVAAALWVEREHPGSLALVVASDHHVPDAAAFASGVDAGRAAAEAGWIVTFGVAPTSPATAFGYIRPGETLSGAARQVAAFVEKPAESEAVRLIADGCLWNSGNFLFRSDRLVAEARRFAPELVGAVEASLEPASAEGIVRLSARFRAAQKVSIDVAVMERTDRAAVVPVAYDWSDLGSWEAVWAASGKDDAGNVVSGEAVVDGSRECLVRAEDGARIVVLGAQGLSIVARGSDVLVSAAGQSARIKPALARIENGHGAPEDPAARLIDAADRLWAWWRTHALPVWWCFGADHAQGGFHEALGHDLTPAPLDRRCRVQARQVFVFAQAGLTEWPGPWREAVTHGLDALFGGFERPDGLFRATTGRGGAAGDDQALLYDQAFVLLALASAARAVPSLRDQYAARAERLAAAASDRFRVSTGGFAADERRTSFLSDPLMHFFEATLAWREVPGAGPIWSRLGGELAELFETRMFSGSLGAVREAYGGDWTPAPGEAGEQIEPGHQFEWAYLLSWMARIDGRASPALVGRLMSTGERGVRQGLVVDGLDSALQIREPGSRLWPQTERLRAALTLANGDAGLLKAASEAALALEGYLTASPPGLWADAPVRSIAGTGEPATASSLYHITGAILSLRLWRLAHGAPAVAPV